MAARRTLTARVDALEGRADASEQTQEKLKSSVATLRRNQRATADRVARLEQMLKDGLANVHEKLDEQTAAINAHVDEQAEDTKRFVLETLVGVARQWPAGAVVALTAVTTLVAAVIANWMLAAEHLPHIH